MWEPVDTLARAVIIAKQTQHAGVTTMNIIRIELDDRIVDRLRSPIMLVWQLFGHIVVDECKQMGEPFDNETAIECCVDADRLRESGKDRGAADLFDLIVTEHGYPSVLKFLSQQIKLV